MKKVFFIVVILLFCLGLFYTTGADQKLTARNKTGSGKQAVVTGSVNSLTADNKITLDIADPTDRQTVNSQTIKVIGKTAPRAEVYVGDQKAIADSSGSFFVNVTLDEGENILTVTANDAAGNYIEKELTVNLESSE